nr:tripeptidyl-peptidase sed2 [Quercus suber]
MVAFSKIAIAIFAAGAYAVPLTLPLLGPLEVFQTLLDIPLDWVSKGLAPATDSIHVQIGLKQSDIAGLQAKLLDISNPKSANYGKWLSKDEVNAFTAPPAENIEAVKAWLTGAGITDISTPSSDWVEFTAPVSQLNTLLDAKYESFWHSADDRTVPRTLQYSVPSSLHDMIDMITPTTAFYSRVAPGVASSVAASSNTTTNAKRQACDTSALVPSCLNTLYNVDYTSGGSALVATADLIGIAASHSDYAAFGSAYVPNLADFTDVSVSDGSNPGSGDQDTLLEGNLDTQWSGGLASPNPNQFIAPGPSGSGGSFADEISNLAAYLTSADIPPSSVSTSYGGNENGFDPDYLDRVCNEFMKAGSMGISVFFSSGDYGVAGIGQTSCSSGFIPQFPATCPWITAVGGTEFDDGVESTAQYDNGGSSGGGFSTHFAAPDYQSADTSAYVSSLNGEYSGLFNGANRGFPDVSLVSKNFNVIINGATINVYGTSASSPSWAALVSVLNDYRASKGEANLGFINPLLYGDDRSATRDVTQGSNRGCDSAGFPAGSGWDAATGLGSLDFGALRALL